MSKTNNLGDFLTDIADAIRAKKGTSESINAQDFSTEIENLPSGGGTKFNYTRTGYPITVTATLQSNIKPERIWSDGTNIYYSNGSDQLVLDNNSTTWTTKTWTGLTSFYGEGIWTDGTEIYYSYSTAQYKLDKSTSNGEAVSGNFFDSRDRFSGSNVGSVGDNIYLSLGNLSNQYVLNKETHTGNQKTGTFPSDSYPYNYGFFGQQVGTDGVDIYYSTMQADTEYPSQLVLNKENSTGTKMTGKDSSGNPGHGSYVLDANRIWFDGTNIYHSYSTYQYILDVTTKRGTQVSGTNVSSFSGLGIGTNGSDMYLYQPNGTSIDAYVLGREFNCKVRTGCTTDVKKI